MAKQTPNNKEQSFVYQLGQDVAKFGIEIEQLKNKTGKALRITVPAVPSKYSGYAVDATVALPDEYQNAVCLQLKGDDIKLVKTTDKLTIAAFSVEQVILLAPVYRLQNVDITAEFNSGTFAQMDAEIERATLAAKEREELKVRETLIYKYLAKWLTDNYLEGVRAKAVNHSFENNGIKVYVNKNGLQALLDRPFERNSHLGETTLDESIYTDAKEAMLAEKARIDRGEVDLSVATDFNVVNYHYIDDIL